MTAPQPGRPRLLDLFCGAGGAAMGYHRAGFDVVGVDRQPQPRYPFEFHQADANEYPLAGFDAVHASPPCHDHSTLRAVTGLDHRTGWMLNHTVQRLLANRVPWVVENVEGARMPADTYSIVLCGSSFGLGVRRHRRFATNILLMALPCDHKRQGQALGVYGHSGGRDRPGRGRKATAAQARTAMGIDWMSAYELAQSIPPAYTEYLGRQLIQSRKVTA